MGGELSTSKLYVNYVHNINSTTDLTADRIIQMIKQQKFQVLKIIFMDGLLFIMLQQTKRLTRFEFLYYIK